jgi:hypothetical protein
MHEAITPGLKFNLDVNQYISSESYVIKGWVATNSPIQGVRLISETEVFEGTYGLERLDVSTYYALPIYRYSGFDFNFKPSVFTNLMMLEAYIEGNWVPVTGVNLLEGRLPLPSGIKVKQAEYKSPAFVVIDDFYEDPDAVREFALGLEYFPSGNHKGKRTNTRLIFDGTKEAIEIAMNRKIKYDGWNYGYNGVFQYCVAEDPLVYHCDSQTYAAVVFLTPDAPPEAGTSFYRSKKNGLWKSPTDKDIERTGKDENTLVMEMFNNSFYDSTRWDKVDTIGNRYNRLAIWDAQLVHAANAYFGNDMYNGRLFHMFFFDCE